MNPHQVNEEDVLALYKSYDVECTIKSQETMDIYLLPPNEDPETCQTWLRMRSRDGKYSLMFEEFVTDDQFIISPRICFEVSVRVMGGLMALGYTMKVVMKRSSRVFEHEHFTVKIDYIEGLDHKYTQVRETG
jgi:adenylate cyclase class IV